MKVILLFGILAIGIYQAISWVGKPDESAFKRVEENGISFTEAAWTDVLSKARQEGKLVFLDAYASWCGPCKLLKKRTFPDQKAGQFFNQHFVSVAIDMEKGEGPALARKYGVDVYPTLIITDIDGKPVAYTKGFMDATQLIEFGEFAIKRAGK